MMSNASSFVESERFELVRGISPAMDDQVAGCDHLVNRVRPRGSTTGTNL